MQLLLPLASLAATALHLPVTLAVASSASYGSAVPSPELHSSSVPPIRVFGQAPVSALVSNSWDDALLIPPPPKKDECECFNCLLPKFTCGQFGECNQFDGQCKCPPGWGGQDCLTPLCDSLADGAERHQRKEGTSCQCDEGWGGLNCNTCQTNDACANFRIPGFDYSDPNLPGNMTCYKGGNTIRENFQMCDVTNPAIIKELNGKRPQVTFSCSEGPASSAFSSLYPKHKAVAKGGNDENDKETTAKTCNFQFWIAERESFYCALEECDWKFTSTFEANATEYKCGKIRCDCVPGRMLCGEDGSVNIDEFLQEEVKGPGSFTCSTGKGCQFKEPAMNDLIDTVFGDPYITLNCDSGECLHSTMIPGYEKPTRPDNSIWVAASAAAAGAVILVCGLLFWYLGRAPKKSGGFGSIHLPADETAKLMSDHVPATLQFSGLSYTASSKQILSSISGSVKPGQIMAIMGASGAGKSTLLDIIAHKAKRGIVSGDIFVNGRKISGDGEAYKRVIGFVDQEDTLMSTLTVYETVLCSAMLRLPRDMSLEAKKFRTLETMQELGILGIKDSRIGESGRRSISGGEKRRVSIACELVTSPSVLLLDEPTSGLDAFNAFNVIESLVSLARDYNRTVVFTIHQPRSNIVALFDRLILLAKGQVVYSGEYDQCQEYFKSLGHPCPPGFNIADFLIDLTMRAAGEESSSDRKDRKAAAADIARLVDTSSSSTETDPEAGHQMQPRPSSPSSSAPSSSAGPASNADAQSKGGVLKRLKDKAARVFGISSSNSAPPSTPVLSALPEKLATLIGQYASSDVAADVRAEIAGARAAGPGPNVTDGTAGNTSWDEGELKGYKKATFWQQFFILSGRAFKNLYRNPMLMAGHFVMTILVALLCALLYRSIGIDLGSFQNRLGLFFFILALFAFSSLTSLGLFANERLLFMRERANGYYSPITYFLSKILFDILPLRIIPSVLLGSIIYGLVGLVPNIVEFWKFILVLVLFNLATASVVLFISVAVPNTGLANLIGSLVMLYNLLFGGLLMNYNQSSLPVRILMTFSFFHAAYEALLVNELRLTQLKDHKYGIDIEVPGATILSTFGFRAQAFWFPDVALLVGTIALFGTLSFVVLHLFVKERR